MRQSTRTLCLLIFFSLASCHNSDEFVAEEAPFETIFKLDDSSEPQGNPFSAALLDDGRLLVVSKMQKVLIYSKTGEQQGQLGHSGRARFEYMNPSAVRTAGDSIYVWSANSLKFIVYDIEGKPHSVYNYRSGVRDFVAFQDSLAIYTTGLRSKNVIDILDKSSQEPHYIKHPSSNEHLLLCHAMQSAPLYAYKNELYYTPLNELDIFSLKNGEPKTVTQRINSPTFKKKAVDDLAAMEDDRKKRVAYMKDNAAVVSIVVGDRKSYILAIEPYRTDTDPEANSCYTLYQYRKNGTGKLVAHYTYDSIGNSKSIFTHNGSIYFIHHSVENDNDVYELRRLVTED